MGLCVEAAVGLRKRGRGRTDNVGADAEEEDGSGEANDGGHDEGGHGSINQPPEEQVGQCHGQ